MIILKTQVKAAKKCQRDSLSTKGQSAKNRPSWILVTVTTTVARTPTPNTLRDVMKGLLSSGQGKTEGTDKVALAAARMERCQNLRPLSQLRKRFLLSMRFIKKVCADGSSAASQIIFDDDEDLYVQAAALQSYLMTHAVNLDAKAAADVECYTFPSGIADSGASAKFFTNTSKVSNAMPHKAQIRIANGQECFNSHS